MKKQLLLLIAGILPVFAITTSCAEDVISATQIRLEPDEIEMYVGDMERLSATVFPENITDKSLTWSSSDESIATVSSDGIVTAISSGTAQIYAHAGSVEAICKVTVSLPVESLQLDKEYIELVTGESVTLKVSITPDNADAEIKWESSSPQIASVSEDGQVTALSEGETTIRANASGIYASCIVKVKQNLVTSITVEPSEITMLRFSKEKITATCYPDDAINQQITWISSNDDYVKVDQDGNIDAIAVGSAIITARCGEVYANCRVTVEGIPVESVTIDRKDATIIVGERIQLNAEVLPENAENRTVTWETSDMNIVSVSETGEVTGVSAGKATITASADGVSSTCEITVESIVNIGDFYYSDGTYSAELDKTKEVIGVIFWIGDPTANDPALKADHPSCTHGLAVAIDGDISTCWQNNHTEYGKMVNDWTTANVPDYMPIYTAMGLKDNLNKTVGYNNTKAIEAFNSASENASYTVEPVVRLNEYRSTKKTPSTSSGWYLPSMKELSLLCSGNYTGNIWDIMSYLLDNKNFVNERLEMIDEAQTIQSGRYWSSCENKDIMSFLLGMDNSFSGCGYKNQEYRVRYILAF